MPLIITGGMGTGGGGGGPFGVTSADLAAGGVVTLNFAVGETPVLTGPALLPASWSVTGPTAITVVSVAVVGLTVVIHTTHPYQVFGAYTLNVPVGIVDTNALPCGGPFAVPFTGVGDVAVILAAAALDARSIRVTLESKPGDSVYVPGNWSIDNDLAVVSVAKDTDSSYILVTSHQLIGTVYTVTAPGVTS